MYWKLWHLADHLCRLACDFRSWVWNKAVEHEVGGTHVQHPVSRRQ